MFCPRKEPVRRVAMFKRVLLAVYVKFPSCLDGVLCVGAKFHAHVRLPSRPARNLFHRRGGPRLLRRKYPGLPLNGTGLSIGTMQICLTDGFPYREFILLPTTYCSKRYSDFTFCTALRYSSHLFILISVMQP